MLFVCRRVNDAEGFELFEADRCGILFEQFMQVFDAGSDMVRDFDDTESGVKELVFGSFLRARTGVLFFLDVRVCGCGRTRVVVEG